METTRTCVACRQKASKAELCRFVRALDGEICFDEKGDLPHRGAWVCAQESCLKKALSKKLLFRGERTLPIDIDALLNSMRHRLKKTALNRLGFLRRLGRIEAGCDAVKRVLSEEKAKAIIFAQDFSLRSKGDIQNKFVNLQPISVFETSFVMDEIGKSLGRKKTGVVALLESRITDEIVMQFNKLKELGC